jgi:anion-transporting  ArsA/GET3 family ATPase
MTTTVRDLVLNGRILVCCGAGGVGKTTIATGLALAAARNGRSVLALTIDPSRRLAETLGVEQNLPAPVSVPQTLLDEAQIGGDAKLEAWMLAPQRVSDRVVRRFASSPERLEKLLNNRIYGQVTRMVAGMQEYTAMEAVHAFVKEGRYDLIVLDTPPSRNALDFLDGPRRLQRFFDGRIFRLFLPGESRGLIRRAASSLIGRVLGAVFGDETYQELQEFFESFSELFQMLTSNAIKMRKMLSVPDEVGFLLVTSTAPESIGDAMFFRRKTIEMGLPFAGYLLNRSHAVLNGRQYPDDLLFKGPPDPVRRSALLKFRELAELEYAEMIRDQQLLDELRQEAGDSAFTMALPTVPGGVDGIPALLDISEVLMRPTEEAEVAAD